MEHGAESEVNIAVLLDLVDAPRPAKRGLPKLDTMAQHMAFNRLVYLAWDHSLRHLDDVQLLSNSVDVGLHTTLLEQLEAERGRMTFKLFARRVFGALLYLIVGGLSAVAIGALIFFEDDVIVPYLAGWNPKSSPYLAEFTQYIVPFGVSLIKVASPFIVAELVEFEAYSGERKSQHIFARVFLLRMFGILVTLFQTANQAEAAEAVGGDDAICAETQIGMVLYRFLLFDIVTECLLYGVLPAIRFCCAPSGCCHRCNPYKQSYAAVEQDDGDEYVLAGDSWKTQLDLPSCLVDVMYRQSIIFCAMYFCPMAPVVGVLANTVTFFVKKRFLFLFCGRPTTASKVRKHLKFFYGMMLLAICVSVVPFLYLLGRTPSCGPHATKPDQTIMAQTLDTVQRDMPPFLRVVCKYVFDPVMLLLSLVLTSVYLMYMRGVKRSCNDEMKYLRNTLEQEMESKRHIYTEWSRQQKDKH